MQYIKRNNSIEMYSNTGEFIEDINLSHLENCNKYVKGDNVTGYGKRKLYQKYMATWDILSVALSGALIFAAVSVFGLVAYLVINSDYETMYKPISDGDVTVYVNQAGHTHLVNNADIDSDGYATDVQHITSDMSAYKEYRELMNEGENNE